MRLRELIKVIPTWTNVCIRDDKNIMLGLNGNLAGYDKYLKQEVLNAEVIEVEIRQPERYENTLDVKIKIEEQRELHPNARCSPRLEIKSGPDLGWVEDDTLKDIPAMVKKLLESQGAGADKKEVYLHKEDLGCKYAELKRKCIHQQQEGQCGKNSIYRNS